MTYCLESRRKEQPTYNKRRKYNWIGHIFRRNCKLQNCIEAKVEERRRGRRIGKQSMDDVTAVFSKHFCSRTPFGFEK
jgi:hypothetical protein